MKALRVMVCTFLAVVLMGACYIASMVLGWFFALLSAAGMVLCIVFGVLAFLYKILQELWEAHHDTEK